MDYNTQREPLIMPEYGREIQNMINYTVNVPDKAMRQVCAETIVKMMATKVTNRYGDTNFEQTLWDHLYIISGKKLEIDWPFDVSKAENIQARPEPMKRPDINEHVRLRHYGCLMEKIFEKLKTMPEGDERDELVRLAANQMKRDLINWGHGSMDDEKVADDLARFTDGRIQLDLSRFTFDNMNMSSNEGQRKTPGNTKKRRQ
ncbi:DUF4290 domain-containing protein [Xylanibacter muris]|uniref:DUF4290 domain-containing protein n=1 Tax=Xylanibacter muris TaxID=2736290 RepID=UPI0032E3B82E